jgi:hypothetical protein
MAMMATKKNKDFVKSILEQMAGKKIEPITKKIRKKKEIQKNNCCSSSVASLPETLEIIDATRAHFVDEFKDKISVRKHKRKNNLSEWLKTDFALYIKDIYANKYQEEWGWQIPAMTQVICRVMDELRDNLGFVSNLVVRDYINYFFEQHLDKLRKQCPKYIVYKLYDKNIIRLFAEIYDYKKAVEKERNASKIQKIENISSITNKDIEESFIISDENTVCQYGIVLTMNWMLMKKKMDKKEIANRVGEACLNIYKAGNFNIIKEATEKFTYPKWFIIQDINILLSIINKELVINAKFNNEDSINKMFQFIKENNE